MGPCEYCGTHVGDFDSHECAAEIAHMEPRELDYHEQFEEHTGMLFENEPEWPATKPKPQNTILTREQMEAIKGREDWWSLEHKQALLNTALHYQQLAQTQLEASNATIKACEKLRKANETVRRRIKGL